MHCVFIARRAQRGSSGLWCLLLGSTRCPALQAVPGAPRDGPESTGQRSTEDDWGAFVMTREIAPIEIRQEYVKARQIPRRYQRQYLRATDGNSPTAAIRAFCQECVGFDFDAVVNCDVTGCPLWSYRPQRREASQATGSGSLEIEPSGAPNVEKKPLGEKESGGSGYHHPAPAE